MNLVKKSNVLEFKRINHMIDISYMYEKSLPNINTRRNYLKHIKPFFNIENLTDIKIEDLSDIKAKYILKYMEENLGESHSNINQFRSALSKLYKYAIEYSYENDLNLVIYNPFEGQSVRDFVKSKEIKSVSNVKLSDLNILDENLPRLMIDEINLDLESETRERDVLIIATLYYTGIRVGKMIDLKVSDVIQYNGRDYLFINKAKGNKNRIVDINTKFAQKLQQYVERMELTDDDYLFRTRYNKQIKSTRAINDMIHKYESILKHKKIISNSTKITAHKFRSLSATLRVKEGWTTQDITNFMGHASFNTTMNYINVKNQIDSDKNDKLFNQLKL